MSRGWRGAFLSLRSVAGPPCRSRFALTRHLPWRRYRARSATPRERSLITPDTEGAPVRPLGRALNREGDPQRIALKRQRRGTANRSAAAAPVLVLLKHNAYRRRRGPPGSDTRCGRRNPEATTVVSDPRGLMDHWASSANSWRPRGVFKLRPAPFERTRRGFGRGGDRGLRCWDVATTQGVAMAGLPAAAATTTATRPLPRRHPDLWCAPQSGSWRTRWPPRPGPDWPTAACGHRRAPSPPPWP